MPTVINCDCNAGMERLILSKTPSGDTNISRNIKYKVYFDLTGSNTPTEKRILRVLDAQTGNKLLEITLNRNAGFKPLNGLTQPYRPEVRPNLHSDVECEIDAERVFYADINLTDDPGIEVRLNIIPLTTRIDKRRFLSFHSTNPGFPRELHGLEIDLNGFGGKKPLESIAGLKPDLRKEYFEL